MLTSNCANAWCRMFECGLCLAQFTQPQIYSVKCSTGNKASFLLFNAGTITQKLSWLQLNLWAKK